MKSRSLPLLLILQLCTSNVQHKYVCVCICATECYAAMGSEKSSKLHFKVKKEKLVKE